MSQCVAYISWVKLENILDTLELKKSAASFSDYNNKLCFESDNYVAQNNKQLKLSGETLLYQPKKMDYIERKMLILYRMSTT
jgi:hypothetical protein